MQKRAGVSPLKRGLHYAAKSGSCVTGMYFRVKIKKRIFYFTVLIQQKLRTRERHTVSFPQAGKGLVTFLESDNHVRQLIRRIDLGVAVGFYFCTALGCVSFRELRRDLAKYCFGSVLYSVPLQADS